MAGKGKNVRAKRPIKKTSDRRRRIKVQTRRLIGLGVPEEKVKNMNPKQVRLLLKRPAEIKK